MKTYANTERLICEETTDELNANVLEVIKKIATKKINIEDGLYKVTKRGFDIFCALIGLIVLLPLTAIVKISYIVTGDKEPVFYTQKRIGKGGVEFKFYKFRSMIPNADATLKKILEENSEMAKEYKENRKISNDPRITKAGKILRKTSLDELPQLINILKGEMSLIGNRPYLPREKEDMGGYYDEIVKTKPGLTGLWQVSGRSNTTFNKRLELESYYSKNMSLKLDIKIFFKTFGAILFSKGAK